MSSLLSSGSSNGLADSLPAPLSLSDKCATDRAYLVERFHFMITSKFLYTKNAGPLCPIGTIKEALNIYFEKLDQNDSLFSVTNLQTRLYDNKFKAINHDPNHLIKTQNLPYIYEENSCLYVFSRHSFLENKNRIGKNPYLFPIDRYEAVDIDEKYDFLMAETLMRNRVGKET